MPELEYNEEKHEYRRNGIHVPNVSEILECAGLQPHYGTRAKEAMVRGGYIHETLEYYDKGTLDRFNLDHRLQPYLSKWDAAKAKIGVPLNWKWGVDYYGEKRLYHPNYHYAGRSDRIYSRLALVEIKSGQKSPWHPLQGAAYWELARVNGFELPRCVIDYLDMDLIEDVNVEQELSVFLAATNLYHWRRAHGIIKENQNGKHD